MMNPPSANKFQRISWLKSISLALLCLALFSSLALADGPFTEAPRAENPVRPVLPAQYVSLSEGQFVVFSRAELDFVDIDADGDFDAFATGGYEDLLNQGRPLSFYENVGTPTEALFTDHLTATNPFTHTPGSSASPAFGDMDADGDYDLFIGGNYRYEGSGTEYGVFYFENVGTPQQASFVLRTEAGQQLDTAGVANVHFAPELGDLDDDGDLDLLVGANDVGLDGTTIFYFENTGTASTPAFSQTQTTGPSNPFGGGLKDFLIPDGDSIPALGDIDHDGDLDLFVGGASGEVYFYENVGSAQAGEFVRRYGAQNPFDGQDVGADSPTGEQRGLGGQSAPTLVDIDADGDLDAFVGEDSGYINFFENQPDPDFPHAAVLEQKAGVDSPFDGISLDVESNPDVTVVPHFVDIDSDGDLDLFMAHGSADVLQGVTTGMSFYENIGSSTQPIYQEILGSAFPFPDPEYLSGDVWPAFADFDGDGDLDMVAGGNQYLDYYENVGDSQNPRFEERTGGTDNPFHLKSPAPGSTGDAYPTATDIDADGDVDVLVSYWSGYTFLFENTGTASDPTFEIAGDLANNPLSALDQPSGDRPTHALSDVDGDGDTDILLAYEDEANNIGRFRYFRNDGSANAYDFQEQIGLATNPFSNTVSFRNPKPDFADVDGDGDEDLFVGHDYGRIQYFRNDDTKLSLTANFDPPTVDTTASLVTVTLTISNGGDTEAQDLSLSNTLPAGLSFGSFVQANGATESGGSISLAPQTLTAGDSLSIVFTVNVDAAAYAEQIIINHAEYSTSNAGAGQAEAGLAVRYPHLSVDVAATGATLNLDDQTTLTIADTTFGEAVTVQYQRQKPGHTGDLLGLGYAYHLRFVDALGQPISPTASYNVEITYANGDLPANIDESTLALYSRQGGVWVQAPSSSLDAAANTITAAPTHASEWAVLGQNTAIQLELGPFVYQDRSGNPARGPLFPGLDYFPQAAIFDVYEMNAITFVDIDNDGDADAFGSGSFEDADAEGRQLDFFENVGTASAPLFERRTGADNPAQFVILPSARPVFGDIDDDGDADLFLGGTQPNSANRAVFVYLNEGSLTEPRFTTYTLTIEDGGIAHNPALADMDADNDLDLVIAQASGTRELQYWENTGDVASPNFVQRNEAADGNPLTSPRDDTDADPIRALYLADINADGKVDLFGGHDSGLISVWENVGANGSTPAFTVTASSFISTTNAPAELFSTTENAEDEGASLTNGRATPTLVDMDNDGDLDLFTGEQTGYINYLENGGTASEYEFTQRYGLHNPFGGVGIGLNYNSDAPVDGAPALVDLDADGDLDLVFGHSKGNGIEGGYTNRLSYYRNDGTATTPVFSETFGAAYPFPDLSTDKWPAFADFDADGDLDMVAGGNQYPRYFENQGTAQAPNFVEISPNADPFPAEFSPDPGSTGDAHPTVADIDADGDYDIVVGYWTGYVFLMENVGTAQNPAFEIVGDLENNPLGVVETPAGRANPTLVDLDFDGDYDLVLGDETGTLRYFRNNGSPSAYEFQEVVGPDDNPLWHALVLGRSRPAFGDLDGDGDPDLLIGQSLGRFDYYRNDSSLPAVSLSKTVNPAEISAETNTVTYTLILESTGQETATAISLSDALPAGVSFSNFISTGGATESGGTVSFGPQDLAPGEVVSISFTAEVDGLSLAGQSVTNTATYAGSNIPGGSASASFSVGPDMSEPPLTVDETGGTFTFTATDGSLIEAVIPPNAVTQTVELRFTPQTEPAHPLPASLNFAGQAFNLSAWLNGEELLGFEFSQPISVSLSYSLQGGSAGTLDLDPATMRLYTFKDGQWQDVLSLCEAQFPGQSFSVANDTAATRLSSPVCGLSNFAVLAEALVAPEGYTVYLPAVLK